MIILQIIAIAVFCYAILRETRRSNEKKALCERCKYLTRKGGSGWTWRYSCERYRGFDRPPEYCGEFKPKEDGE